MFGLGMMEVGLVVILAVMLFPPKELPKLARMVARVYGQVRKTAEDFRSAVLDDEDLRSPIDEIKGAYNEARFEVRDAERKARQELAKAQMELRMATARRLQAERETKAAEAAASTAKAGTEGGAAVDAAVASTSEASEASAAVTPAVTPAVKPAAKIASASDASSTDEHAPTPARAAPSANGPVASADPRVIAGRRSGAYTPRAYTPPAPPIEAPAPVSTGERESHGGGDSEAQEGVA